MNSPLKGFITGEVGGHLGLIKGERGEQEGERGRGQRDVRAELDPLDQLDCNPKLVINEPDNYYDK